ncbi:hypothetical protein F2Q68_00011401 [Brassica cretica]|uniref:Uncharacterized protein n=1 Tax=Brassica cretica TaxID=69181 RepID=A0A8S9KWB5_BRACR|nr:hypothetical protein F2Q68_00011401 [Brassica cretica]
MIKLKEGGLVFKRPKANECGCYLRKKTLLCGLGYRVTETVNSECVSETYDQILSDAWRASKLTTPIG